MGHKLSLRDLVGGQTGGDFSSSSIFDQVSKNIAGKSDALLSLFGMGNKPEMGTLSALAQLGGDGGHHGGGGQGGGSQSGNTGAMDSQAQSLAPDVQRKPLQQTQGIRIPPDFMSMIAQAFGAPPSTGWMNQFGAGQ